MKVVYFFIFLFNFFLKIDAQIYNDESEKLLIDPIKIDSLLDQKFLISIYFSSSQKDKEFEFNTPISSAKIYQIYAEDNPDIQEKNDDDIISKINFNNLGKLNSFENFVDNKKIIIIYSDKMKINYIIYHVKDEFNNEEYDDIYNYKYYENGNLKTKYEYRLNNRNEYDLLKYSEFHYSSENSKTIVDEFCLTTINFEKKRMYFNSLGQLEAVSEHKKAIIKNFESKIFIEYHYGIGNLQKKLKKEIYKVKNINPEYDIDEINATEFLYDNIGREIEKKETSNNEVWLLQRIFNDKENTILEETKKLNLNVKSGVFQTLKIRYCKKMFDDFGNVIYLKEFEDKETDTGFYNTYEFDSKNNWIKKIVKNHFDKIDLHKDDQKNSESLDDYSVLWREINYSDYESLFTPNMIDEKSSKDFLNSKLQETKFYEIIKNL